ncbi:MAG TPA: CPBP family intramembrane glutamic endopeptidase [Candidatus Deferrimicrobium sp.]|nr:CPBP family intramembrane glutamic endopeptidase [Candidatus Deferrimicrobium sp.]
MDNVAHDKQYSLTKILFLWLLVIAPMGLARFWIVPQFKDQVSIHPGLFYWWLMIAGMVWQFVLSVIVLKLELKTITWSTLKTRLWLNHPIDPKSQRVIRRAYWLTIPVILYAFLLESYGTLNFLQEWFLRVFPSLAPPDFTLIQNLATPEFRGAWYLVGITLVSSLFNYLLGEELFFRGVLLPKMEGVFGRWAWAANGILFATYHVHKFEWVPVFIFGSIFTSYLNQKYRSFYPGLIIHGVEFIPLFIMITLFVAGL